MDSEWVSEVYSRFDSDHEDVDVCGAENGTTGPQLTAHQHQLLSTTVRAAIPFALRLVCMTYMTILSLFLSNQSSDRWDGQTYFGV